MKKIWKYLLLIVINVIMKQTVLTAQNLVPNGSFEQYYSCPDNTAQVDSCIGWHMFGGINGVPGTPDFFDSCSVSFVGVPNNIFGTQIPFEGSAYMGIFTFDFSYWYREYIGVELSDTMIPGNNYRVSMRISRGNCTSQVYACIASNKVGMRFTTFWYPFDSIIPVINYAQLYEDSIISDTLNWTLLHWNFVPDSEYTHIYIGNFFESDSTDTIQVVCPSLPGRAYYFIDSINIVCTSTNCFTSLNEIKNDKPVIFYNMEDKTIYCEGFREKQYMLMLYGGTGQMVLKRFINDNERINISKLNDGFYTAVLRSAHKTTYKKIIKY